MSVTSSYKKCPVCNHVNIDADICTNCGEILSYKKKMELKKQKILQQEIEALKYKEENPNFVERLKGHRYFLFRIVGYILYSTILIVTAIGSAIAWFTAMVLGG